MLKGGAQWSYECLATANITQAERRLRMAVRGLLETPLEQYYRQYVGISVQERRRLYVHAFQPIRGIPIDKTAPNWRRQYFWVCDGNEASWGIEFDIETQTFRNFRRNGPRG